MAKRCSSVSLSVSYNVLATVAGMAWITDANAASIAMYQLKYRSPRRPHAAAHSPTSMGDFFFLAASFHFLSRLTRHLPNATSLTRHVNAFRSVRRKYINRDLWRNYHPVFRGV